MSQTEATQTEAPEAEPIFDDDNPEWTEEDFARAFGPEHLPPEVLAAFPRTAERVARMRGAQKAPTKRLTSLRLDPEVVDHFRATGPGWQSRINTVLREAIGLKPA